MRLSYRLVSGPRDQTDISEISLEVSSAVYVLSFFLSFFLSPLYFGIRLSDPFSREPFLPFHTVPDCRSCPPKA